MSTHICFLSNGYGEERSAALIARELRTVRPDLCVSGISIVTPGWEYARHSIPILYEGEMPPSGGFPTKSLPGLLRDLHFLPKQVCGLRAFVRKQTTIDNVVAVGDITLLLIARKMFHKPTVLVALPKSDYKRPHSLLETSLLRRIACPVLTRDACTRDTLCLRHIDAFYLGNPLMDGLTPSGLRLAGSPMVGLLPGSRVEAYNNFRRIARVVSLLPAQVNFACALPPSLVLQRVADTVTPDGWVLSGNMLKNGDRAIQLVQNGFEDVICAAEVIIGLAGTANEQAAGLGKPVVTFEGCGPQTTRRRMKDQELMLGGTARFVPDFPHGVADEVSLLLAQPHLREIRGRMGHQHMGDPGGSRRIAEFLISSFEV